MTKQTWLFHDHSGHIPGIPGEFHAGQEVDIDPETMQVLEVRTPGVQTPPQLSPFREMIQQLQERVEESPAPDHEEEVS